MARPNHGAVPSTGLSVAEPARGGGLAEGGASRVVGRPPASRGNPMGPTSVSCLLHARASGQANRPGSTPASQVAHAPVDWATPRSRPSCDSVPFPDAPAASGDRTRSYAHPSREVTQGRRRGPRLVYAPERREDSHMAALSPDRCAGQWRPPAVIPTRRRPSCSWSGQPPCGCSSSSPPCTSRGKRRWCGCVVRTASGSASRAGSCAGSPSSPCGARSPCSGLPAA